MKELMFSGWIISILAKIFLIFMKESKNFWWSHNSAKSQLNMLAMCVYTYI